MQLLISIMKPILDELFDSYISKYVRLTVMANSLESAANPINKFSHKKQDVNYLSDAFRGQYHKIKKIQ